MRERIIVGDVIQDNDPRLPRKGTVISTSKTHVEVAWGTDTTIRHSKIALSRVYDDDKARKSGYSLVKRS